VARIGRSCSRHRNSRPPPTYDPYSHERARAIIGILQQRAIRHGEVLAQQSKYSLDIRRSSSRPKPVRAAEDRADGRCVRAPAPPRLRPHTLLTDVAFRVVVDRNLAHQIRAVEVR
jgi:hypothetical protein